MAQHKQSRLYRGLWPLPGGHSHFLATLLEILSFVEHDHPGAQDLYGWMRQQYRLGTESTTPTGYIQVIARMGYLVSQRDSHIEVTERGRHLLVTRDSGIVLDGLMRECLGTYDVLKAVGKLGAANGKSVLGELSSSYPLWTTVAQFDWRLQWLHSLGCLEKVDGRYLITPLGRAALLQFAELRVSPNSVASFQIPSSQQSPTPTNSMPEDSSSEDLVPMDSLQTAPELVPIAVIRDEADRLAEHIRTRALESDDASGFERVLVDAFRFIGFDAEHKGGSGDTDVLVVAHLGQETYRAIVDGKSSRHGKVAKQQIDWLALSRHKQLNQADYILLVAPGFSSGDLLDNATKTDAALLTADDLAAVIRLHASSPLSLADLRELFRYAGHPELPLQRVQEKAAEVVRLQRLVPDIVRTFEHSYRVGVSGPIAADALHLILARDYGRAVYSKEEIAAALDLLCTPLIGALRRVSDTAFTLQMPMASVGRRFQTQARQLLDAAINSSEDDHRNEQLAHQPML